MQQMNASNYMGVTGTSMSTCVADFGEMLNFTTSEAAQKKSASG